MYVNLHDFLGAMWPYSPICSLNVDTGEIIEKEIDAGPWVIIPKPEKKDFFKQYMNEIPIKNWKRQFSILYEAEDFTGIHHLLYKCNLYNDWQAYYYEKQLDFIEEWCVKNGIPYTRKKENRYEKIEVQEYLNEIRRQQGEA